MGRPPPTSIADKAATLDRLTPGSRVRGVIPDQTVEVLQAKWFGSAAVELTYRTADGKPGQEILYRSDEERLTIETGDRAWAFYADARLFRLASEALRIRLAYLFDPYLAVHTSNLEPLPHQITAVYEEMLPRQPLRFLLADDPGAGTIMAGLLIKELMVRGDLSRCLVVAPGSLVEQWQDELWRKLGLTFELIGRDAVEASRNGNPFAEKNLVFSRLDHLSRNEDVQAKLVHTEWDLVIVDEAHKMSAHYFGNDVKETRRYRLGKMLGDTARHLLLMTATPHSGKDEDFQLFLSLLDADRFEAKALGGQVFDVLGRVFVDEPLRDLLMDAVRYGDQPEVRARIDEVVDAAVGRNLKERALVSDVLSPADVEELRADELQPPLNRPLDELEKEEATLAAAAGGRRWGEPFRTSEDCCSGS